MAHPHHAPASAPAKAAPSPFVEVTIVFRDTLQKPIEGLSVLVKAGAGAPQAPEWKCGQDSDDPPAVNPASAPGGASAAGPASASGGASASAPTVSNRTEVVTDANGYAVTIQNAARNQPIAVWVKNRSGKYVLKATVTPKKDISAFTIVSPEYHLEATTKLTPKDELEQELDLPVVKEGEVMTIERLVKDFGPYIGWSQKVTEQGQVKKDFPTRKKEVTEDERTHKKKPNITIEHHYKVVDNGKPRTIVLNVLGSRLNYPKPETFSEDQYTYMAAQLGVEVAAIKAIVQQESQGHPFLKNGLPPILYERRHFFDLAVEKQSVAEKESNTNVKGAKAPPKKKARPKNPYPAYPDLCFKGADDYGPDGLHQYEKLVRAAALDFEIALKACSWGGFQILGEYYAGCDCSTVFEFANKFMSGTDGQAKIFVSFMKNMKAVAVVGLKNHDWEKVAAGYNGKNWQTHNPDYASNLGKFYDQFK
ncbi:hypothetical protein HDG34_002560 [Paraburkholderia sp. HC6.4b]|uniref:N-acetylmuramidase family protein n=1 Tax=unclassified Paraburkholderia TaxID=2615204 RepID=UPI001611CE95|nr:MULTISPECIES: N-acetylmuramidase family protein [unclassified Paraburkholderia]MBB5408623.1 hypothetical protein [Paraburkholderia sp. HC6.4b]MBB5450455.1 hypothetical protein [Paraburkholderia sp. Kb1A]